MQIPWQCNSTQPFVNWACMDISGWVPPILNETKMNCGITSTTWDKRYHSTWFGYLFYAATYSRICLKWGHNIILMFCIAVLLYIFKNQIILVVRLSIYVQSLFPNIPLLCCMFFVRDCIDWRFYHIFTCQCMVTYITAATLIFTHFELIPHFGIYLKWCNWDVKCFYAQWKNLMHVLKWRNWKH